MNRLETIKSMVSRCGTAADIGTDHGYVAEMLLSDNTVKRVVATDLNEGPLKRAVDYLTSINLSEQCEFRLGSGLTVLKENEADAIIIAGMGGELIADILDTSKEVAFSAKELILQPMTAVSKLRRYLYENGYKITDENIVREYHHFYFIIKAVYSGDEPEIIDDIYFEISRHLIDKKDPTMYEYIDRVLNTNKKIISSLEKAGNLEYNKKIEMLKEKNNKILRMMT